VAFSWLFLDYQTAREAKRPAYRKVRRTTLVRVRPPGRTPLRTITAGHQKQHAHQQDGCADNDSYGTGMPPVMEMVTATVYPAMNIVRQIVAKLIRVEIAHSLSLFQVEPNRLPPRPPQKIGELRRLTGERHPQKKEA
jgi:hypothetical protein